MGRAQETSKEWGDQNQEFKNQILLLKQDLGVDAGGEEVRFAFNPSRWRASGLYDLYLLTRLFVMCNEELGAFSHKGDFEVVTSVFSIFIPAY